jgi:hypothetical protein
MDSFFEIRLASPAWIFGDPGRPFLGNRSYGQLSQMVGTIQRAVLLPLIKRYGKKHTLPDGRVGRVSLLDVGADITEVLSGSEFEGNKAIAEAAYYVDHLPNSKIVGDLQLKQETLETLSSLGVKESDSIAQLGGLAWHEIVEAGGGWLQILEIAHNLYDWLPWLEENELEFTGKDSLLDAVSKLTSQASARNGMDIMEMVSWSGFIAARYGWGVEKLSLDQIGAVIGVTRERVRQIQAKVVANLDLRGRKLPQILEDILSHSIENPSDEICNSLRRDGFDIGDYWTWPALLELYELLGHGERAGEWYSANGMTGAVLENRKSIDKSIRKARAIMGVIKMNSVPDVENGITISEDVVRERIPIIFPNYSIFENYAVVSTKGASSIVTETSKQLGVSSPLSVDVIYKGLMQVAVYRHSQNVMPPARILRNLLLDLGFSEDSEGLLFGPKKELSDGQNDRWLLDFILNSPGQCVSKAAIFRAAIPLGISLNTLSIYLSYASWVRLIGNGIFSVVGVNPTASEIDFAERVEAALAVPNSHADFSVAPDGKEITVAAIFSTPLLVNGVLAAGRQLVQLLGHTKREIACCDGIEMGGRADVKQGAVHGFATLRQHLIQAHGYSEGMTINFRVTDTSFLVVH